MRLVLSPSPALAAVIVLLHAAAGLCAFLVMRGWVGALLGLLVLALGLAAAWSRALLRSSRSVRALELATDAVVVELANGERLAAAHPARCYVSRLAVVLPSPRSILVSADMLRPAEFRRLRVWLLWGRLAAVAGKQLPA